VTKELSVSLCVFINRFSHNNERRKKIAKWLNGELSDEIDDLKSEDGVFKNCSLFSHLQAPEIDAQAVGAFN
jgi:hypothetical protein